MEKEGPPCISDSSRFGTMKAWFFSPFPTWQKKGKSRFFSKAASPQGAKTGEELELVFPPLFFSLPQCGKKKCESIIFLSQKGPFSQASCEAVRVESRRALETREGMSCWPQVKNPRPHLWKKGESRVREWPNFWPGAGKTSCCSDRAKKKGTG